jgi:hypothetical protein
MMYSYKCSCMHACVHAAYPHECTHGFLNAYTRTHTCTRAHPYTHTALTQYELVCTWLENRCNPDKRIDANAALDHQYFWEDPPPAAPRDLVKDSMGLHEWQVSTHTAHIRKHAHTHTHTASSPLCIYACNTCVCMRYVCMCVCGMMDAGEKGETSGESQSPSSNRPPCQGSRHAPRPRWPASSQNAENRPLRLVTQEDAMLGWRCGFLRTSLAWREGESKTLREGESKH